VSAWREPRGSHRHLAAPLAAAIYFGAALGLLGIILWRLWTEVLAGLAL
jgi:hypothetical protein